MANPFPSGSGPLYPPCSCMGRKTATPCQAVSSDGPTPAFPLVRLFPTKRVAGTVRGPNWVQRGNSREEDGADTGWGTRRALWPTGEAPGDPVRSSMHTKVPSPHGAPKGLQGQKRGPERPQSLRCEVGVPSSHCDPVVAPGWHTQSPNWAQAGGGASTAPLTLAFQVVSVDGHPYPRERSGEAQAPQGPVATGMEVAAHWTRPFVPSGQQGEIP